MDKSLLEGTWQEFEALIRDTIGSDFRWRVRPQDTRSNREMIVSLILEDIKRNNGAAPRIVCKGPSLSDSHLEVSGCCQKFTDTIQKKLIS